MTRGRALILLLVLPPVGALLGSLAGPTFARANARVRLAEQVWREERELAADRESEAYGDRLRATAARAESMTLALAAAVWRRSAQAPVLTEKGEAFRRTGREPLELYAEARAVERRLRSGALWLGAFLGLVVGLKLLAFAVPGQRRIYEIDQAACVSCGRCFATCPREHVRLSEQA